MTFQPDPDTFSIPPKLRLAAERSDWLDSFSRLEVAVIRCGDKFLAKAASRGTPLTQRLKALASVEPSPCCAKILVKELRECMQECEKLLPLRATIVHAVMQTGRLGDCDIALFQNGVDAARNEHFYLVMQQEDFRRTRETLDRLTDRLKNLSKPSSPPQPKPAAAADP